MNWIVHYWWVALIASVAAILIIWLILRPRQRVTLSDSAPLRPHMAHARGPDQAAAPTTNAALHEALAHPDGEADDLGRMKGVGPKFASTLVGLGITRFEQLAALEPEDTQQLDDHLGPFRGRIQRDRLIEQARYLARDDIAGFESHFGKL